MRGFGVFLAVFAACVATAALVAVLLWPHLRNLSNPIDEARARAKAEATTFAGEHAQVDCAPEAFRRMDACDGIWCMASTPDFTRECLRLAAPSPSLCDEIPDSMVLALAWPATECLEIQAEPELCRRILGEIVTVCRGGAKL